MKKLTDLKNTEHKIVWVRDNSGESGWVLEDMPWENIDTICTTKEGKLIAHDLIEHADYTEIGGGIEELRAIGSAAEVRKINVTPDIIYILENNFSELLDAHTAEELERAKASEFWDTYHQLAESCYVTAERQMEEILEYSPDWDREPVEDALENFGSKEALLKDLLLSVTVFLVKGAERISPDVMDANILFSDVERKLNTYLYSEPDYPGQAYILKISDTYEISVEETTDENYDY